MSSKPVKLPNSRPYTFGPLYDLLKVHFPEHRSAQGVFNVPGFAKDLGYAPETLYKAVRQTAPLKLGVAHRVIKFSHDSGESVPLYWDDLVEFILPEFAEYSRSGLAAVEVDDLLA